MNQIPSEIREGMDQNPVESTKGSMRVAAIERVNMLVKLLRSE